MVAISLFYFFHARILAFFEFNFGQVLMYYNEDIVLDENDFNGQVIIQAENFMNQKDLLIKKVIQYLIKDEKKHYEELDKPNEHIYNILLELKEILNLKK